LNQLAQYREIMCKYSDKACCRQQRRIRNMQTDK